MTTLQVLLHVAAQHDYELHSLDFSTPQLSFYGLHQTPREWHDTLRMTLAAIGFAPLTADQSLFLRTDSTLLPFYILVYVNDLVFATADTEALTLVKAEMQEGHTCTDLGPSTLWLQFSSPQRTLLPIGHSLSAPPSDESVEPSGPPGDTGRSTGHLRRGYCVTWRTGFSGTHRTLRRFFGQRPGDSAVVTGLLFQSRLCFCLVEVHSCELRWLTYLLTDLGERPHSPPVLYVDNKAMIALCWEQRLEHRTKHIDLCYFLAQEQQHLGQLCLAFVASRANTADVFTKALMPSDHQHFCTALGLVPTLPHLLVA
ncbi:unnamed protein product [Closterium sp. NIES-54]